MRTACCYLFEEMRAFQSAACRTMWCVLLVDALLVLSRLGRCLLSFFMLTGLLCLQRLMRPHQLAQGKSRHQFINTIHCTPTPAPTPTRRHSTAQHNTKHKTQNTEHRTQNTKQKTQNGKHKTHDKTPHDTTQTPHTKSTHTHAQPTTDHDLASVISDERTESSHMKKKKIHNFRNFYADILFLVLIPAVTFFAIFFY